MAKKTIKKIIVFVLAALTLIIPLGGCSCNDNTEEQPAVFMGNLCKDGEALYDIVIPSEAGAAVVNAAEELTEYVYKVSGARLNLKYDSGESGSNFISLGDTAELKKAAFEVDYDSLGSDGFVMKTLDKNYYITARTDRGVLYGVYEFLEKTVGVKFIAYDYTYIPSEKTIPLYETDVTEIPDIQNRCYLSNQLMFNNEFAAHMRMTNEFLTPMEKYGGGLELYKEKVDQVHNTLDYLTEDYYSEHSDWYFVNNGEIYDIHFSNVGLNEDGSINESLEISPVKIVIENIKKYIQESDSTIFMIGQEDRVETCTCEECKRQEAKFGRSGMMVRFVNAVIREVTEWMDEAGIDRDIRFGTFAYYYSQLAPVDAELNPLDPSVIPHEKLYIRLAPITAYNYFGLTDENQLITIRNMISGWMAVTDRIMVWTYHTAYSGYFCYYPTMQHWAEDLRLYAENDALYVLMQSAYNVNAMWTNQMETYVASKMLWDCSLSVEELKREFIKYYYAGIEEEITEFIDTLDMHYAIFMEPGNVEASLWPDTRIGGADSIMNPQLYSVNFWENLLGILDRADDKINTLDISEKEKEVLHDRVGMVRLTPQYMIMMKYDMYYPDDTFGKFEFYKAFFDSCAKYNVTMITESQSVDGLKFSLGYTV